MLTPTGLKVRGFRGFLSEQPFEFNERVTILFGENRRGKSSALNAIEWALFGADCAGSKTNIRERVGWEIPNRHAGASDVFVELTLSGPGGEYIVRRSLSKPSGKRSTKRSPQGLEIELPDGEELRGVDAEERLAHLLGCSFRDFMTMAYQHQEAIRDILTQEPRHRDDAIDRLLGLSDYRNLLAGIKGADAAGLQKRIVGRCGDFEAKVQSRLDDRESQLNEKRQEVAEAGVAAGRITFKTALGYAAAVREALAGFAEEAGIEAAPLETPEEMKELARFVRAAKAEIDRLRGEMPEGQKQERLFERQTEAGRLKTRLREAKEKQKNLSQAIRDMDKKHRGQQAVHESIGSVGSKLKAAKARLREVDARAALIHEAIDYLAQAEGEESRDQCPVCGSDAPDLLERLREQWEKKLEGQSAKLGEPIRQLEGCLTELEGVASRYEKADGEQVRLSNDIADGRREAGELLEKELAAQDDAIALLQEEDDRIGRRLEELKTVVRQRQERLNGIAAELEKVRLIRELLQLEEKKKLAEAIQKSPEWGELEAIRNRAAQLVEDVKAIQVALNTASQEEAAGKIAAAASAIDAYFRKLTRHPAVAEVKLAVERNAMSGQNKYTITDQDGNDLMPILSQGDLNALALAIFLGLATGSGQGAPFGFVMLDDPSQSLGTEHKRKLVSVLDQVADSRQVIVATMDQEFHDCLGRSLTKAQAEYVFEEWTPANGARAKRRE